jgi:hypothetical protein
MNAGWHPDPSGKNELRYWDGSRWTDHVSTGGNQQTDPLLFFAPAPHAAPPFAPNPVTGWGWSRSMDHPEGTTILVLGILSLVICGILGPIAWVKGNRAMAEIESQPQTVWTNRGQVRAGQICGIVSSCLLIISAAILLLAMFAFAAGAD